TAGGYTRVRELSVGDLVATVRRYRFSGVPQPREKVVSAAYMLAEAVNEISLGTTSVRSKVWLAGDARVPDWVLGADSESVALFLNRFFVCVGSISTFKIETTLPNRGLCEDLSFLL